VSAIHAEERAERASLSHQADPAYPASPATFPIYRPLHKPLR
jgi:hypothetical protein